MLKEGASLGGVRLEKLIHRSNEGERWRGFRLRDNMPMEICQAAVASSEEMALQEALDRVARLRGPHVLPVEVLDERGVIAWERPPGVYLSEAMKRRVNLPVPEMLEAYQPLLTRVAGAVDSLERMGLGATDVCFNQSYVLLEHIGRSDGGPPIAIFGNSVKFGDFSVRFLPLCFEMYIAHLLRGAGKGGERRRELLKLPLHAKFGALLGSIILGSSSIYEEGTPKERIFLNLPKRRGEFLVPLCRGEEVQGVRSASDVLRRLLREEANPKSDDASLPDPPVLAEPRVNHPTVTISWRPVWAGGGESELHITRALKGGNYETIHTVSPGMDRYQDVGVPEGTWNYRLTVTDGVNFKHSSAVAVEAVPLAAKITSLSAKSERKKGIVLSWNSMGPGTPIVEVERKAAQSEEWMPVNLEYLEPKKGRDAEVKHKQEYIYRIRAVPVGQRPPGDWQVSSIVTAEMPGLFSGGMLLAGAACLICTIGGGIYISRRKEIPLNSTVAQSLADEKRGRSANTQPEVLGGAVESLRVQVASVSSVAGIAALVKDIQNARLTVTDTTPLMLELEGKLRKMMEVELDGVVGQKRLGALDDLEQRFQVFPSIGSLPKEFVRKVSEARGELLTELARRFDGLGPGSNTVEDVLALCGELEYAWSRSYGLSVNPTRAIEKLESIAQVYQSRNSAKDAGRILKESIRLGSKTAPFKLAELYRVYLPSASGRRKELYEMGARLGDPKARMRLAMDNNVQSKEQKLAALREAAKEVVKLDEADKDARYLLGEYYTFEAAAILGSENYDPSVLKQYEDLALERFNETKGTHPAARKGILRIFARGTTEQLVEGLARYGLDYSKRAEINDWESVLQRALLPGQVPEL